MPTISLLSTFDTICPSSSNDQDFHQRIKLLTECFPHQNWQPLISTTSLIDYSRLPLLATDVSTALASATGIFPFDIPRNLKPWRTIDLRPFLLQPFPPTNSFHIEFITLFYTFDFLSSLLSSPLSSPPNDRCLSHSRPSTDQNHWPIRFYEEDNLRSNPIALITRPSTNWKPSMRRLFYDSN